MKKFLLTFLALLSLWVQAAFAHNPDKVYNAANERFYNVPGKHIVAVNERGLAHDELAAVLYISELSNSLPERIADLRKEGKSWTWIMETFNVGPDSLYVPVKSKVTKPPFDRVYGYFQSKQKSEWRSIKLSDAEVIDLINLRFLSRYFKVKPETIMAKREVGEGYVDICHFFATPPNQRRLIKKPDAEATAAGEAGEQAAPAPKKPSQGKKKPAKPEAPVAPEAQGEAAPPPPPQKEAEPAAQAPATEATPAPQAPAGNQQGSMMPHDPEEEAAAAAAAAAPTQPAGGQAAPQQAPAEQK